MISLVLHLSDLQNPAKDWPIAFLWAQRISQEFISISQREKELGLEQTKHMVGLEDQEIMMKQEIGFI